MPPSTADITAAAGPGGSISPGTTTVTLGDSITFTITAEPGFCVARVTIDGTSIGFARTYTFTNVQADHAITVSFTRDFVNAICDALVQLLQTECTGANGYSVDFSAAGALVERNPGFLDWQGVPRPYACVAYLVSPENTKVASGGSYRSEADFLVRFVISAREISGSVMSKELGERLAAKVMQELMRAVANEVNLYGVLETGWIWPKESNAGQDPNAGSVICGGEITFGATWVWTA